MGRKQGVGRALVNLSNKKKRNAGFRHPSEVQSNVAAQGSSVTQESSVDEFFAMAQLSNANFAAQRFLPKVVDVREGSRGILSMAQEKELLQLHEDKRDFLRIPRRPAWDSSTSKEELQAREGKAFLQWRRRLASLEDNDKLVMTPFEKNLDFWRQLWRVIERSDCVVQIVDCRNPLLFRCEDLEAYVREVNRDKTCCILANKADLLTERQRELWADYFSRAGIRVIFWSAKNESAKSSGSAKVAATEEKGAEKSEEEQKEEREEEQEEEREEEQEEEEDEKEEEGKEEEAAEDGDAESAEREQEALTERLSRLSTGAGGEEGACSSPRIDNSPHLVTAQQLLAQVWDHHRRESGVVGDELFTIGLVGYPNVGKSSTLNAILNAKRVPVSATPGRTKHFQTFNVPFGPGEGRPAMVQLCDCPGLVMPSFVFSKPHLFVSGILPVDNMRDYFSPISVICTQFPREMLMGVYGINIPPPPMGDDPDRHPTARELLEAYSYMHGFMSSQGLPNCDRAARIILKDYINGRLLYCHPPPDVSVSEFCPLSGNERVHARKLQLARTKMEAAAAKGATGGEEPQLTDWEREMLLSVMHPSGSGFRGKARPENFGPSCLSSRAVDGRPSKKHGNAKKREKLRRVYAHLDDQ